jgi:predicted dehydrogenase
VTELPPVRIGVLGAARIVKNALITPAHEIPGVEVTAVAAREPARASAFAATSGIRHVHQSYDALLADPYIDGVYVPLPAALHAKWTIAAVEAGKHVLCEKPFTSNALAAQRVADKTSASKQVVMEAYHSHFHPLYGRLREIIASAEIGTVRSARAVFCVPIPPGRDIRWNPALAGGGLLDVGYYPVRALTELFGVAPEVTDARAWRRGDIDRRMEANLRWDSGVAGQIVSSIWSRRVFSMSLRAFGDEGKIRVSFPFHPQMGTRITVDGLHGRRSERAEKRSTYSYQLEAFRDAVRGTVSVETTPTAAVAHMQTLDEIYRAAGMDPRTSLPDC